ncbi:MAG TPA: hypothetical protein VGG95_05265 [Edaphobacter sp.]
MSRKRSIFFHGFGIALHRFPAFLWTYFLNLGLALAFCLPLYRQLSSLLDHSLASQRLSSGFDLAAVVSTATQIHGDQAGHANAMTTHGSVIAYFVLYFFLVPGTLFCYVTRSKARLSNLVRQGILHFWRFVRITLLTLIVSGIILGALFLLQRRWAEFIDDRFVGRTSLVLTLGGVLLLILVASLLRLYFDLVEVYTVQLGTHTRPSGRSDRRVRRTLGPAFRLLRQHLVRAWGVFLLLTLLGWVAAFFATRTAMHMLAQPRVWPMFLVAQAGMFAMLFTRFWQRGAEASLVLQHPIQPEAESFVEQEGYPYTRPIPSIAPASKPSKSPLQSVVPSHSDSDRPHHVEMIYNPDPLIPLYPAPLSPDDTLAASRISESAPPADPIPDPEPAVPSLDEPDPGVFHHEPTRLHENVISEVKDSLKRDPDTSGTR